MVWFIKHDEFGEKKKKKGVTAMGKIKLEKSKDLLYTLGKERSNKS